MQKERVVLYFHLLMEETSSVFSESPFGTQPSTQTPSLGKGPGRKGKKLIFLIIIIIILAAIAFGAMQLLGNNSGTTDITPTPTVEEFVMPTDEPAPTEAEEKDTTPAPTSKASATNTPTPTKTATSSSNSVDAATKLDRADITILVQNGSGEAGVAKVMSDKLTGLGYKVSGTANADNYDYAQTVIKVSGANKDFLPLLKKDLGTDYTIGSATSDYSGTDDAVVIVGKE